MFKVSKGILRLRRERDARAREDDVAVRGHLHGMRATRE